MAAPKAGTLINGSLSPCNMTCRNHKNLVILSLSVYGVLHLEHPLIHLRRGPGLYPTIFYLLDH